MAMITSVEDAGDPVAQVIINSMMRRLVQLKLEFREIDIAHQHSFVRIPIAPHFLITTNGQTMVLVNAWSVRLYQQTFGMSLRGSSPFLMSQQRLSKSRCIKVLLFR